MSIMSRSPLPRRSASAGGGPITTARARCGSWDAGGSRFCDADVMLFIGNNPGVSAFSRDGGPPYANGFGYLKEAGRRGMKIIAIDPRRTELARRADLHLQVRPGEDPTLLAGMLRTILEEGLYDREFTDAHVEGLAALREAVADYTPDYVERRSLVPASQVVEAARLFARGRSGSAMRMDLCGWRPQRPWRRWEREG